MNSFKKSASFSPCSKNVNKDSLGFNYCFEYALFVFRIDKENVNRTLEQESLLSVIDNS